MKEFELENEIVEIDEGLKADNDVASPTTVENEENEENEGNEENEENEIEPVGATLDQAEDVTQTQAFSKRLAEARATDLREVNELRRLAVEREREMETLLGAVSMAGYEGSPQEVADMIMAAQHGVSAEQVKAEREAQQAMVNSMVENHPAILEARRMQEAQQHVITENRIKEDVRIIQGLNPDIKTMADLAKHPHAHLVSALVKDGATYADAYKQIHELAHGKKLSIAANTKEHLKGVDGGGAAGTELVDIPQGEFGTWKSAFPDVSLKELKIKYNNALNR